MAKKKKRKEEKKSSSYGVELKGLLLILISLIGLCEFGIVGTFFKGFAAFLVGEWYSVLFVILAAVGIYMMVKREKPNFFNSNLIGLYILMLAILVLSHLDYSQFKGFEIIEKTFENSWAFIKNSDIKLYGGGIIGGAFSALFILLFDKEGTMVVSWVLISVGTIMFTGLSIYDVIKWMKNKAGSVTSKSNCFPPDITPSISKTGQ